LSALPITIEIVTPRGLMLLGHGLGADDMATLQPHDHGLALTHNKVLQKLVHDGRYKLVLGGHTHRRMVRSIDGLTFINAGSIATQAEACCSVIDFAKGRVEFYDLGADGSTHLGPEFPF
jgi:predicted phosphodiesterase